MCCWPFVDVIVEESPPERERVEPTAAVGKQDQPKLVSDRLHMHPVTTQPSSVGNRNHRRIEIHHTTEGKSTMGDTNFHYNYVPPSKRPKAPTPPPEPKETNPWLISQPTPTPNPDGAKDVAKDGAKDEAKDGAKASPEPGPSHAQGNNPWLISNPSPNVAAEPAAKAAPVAPPLPHSIPGFVYAAFPAIPVNTSQRQAQGQLFVSGPPVPIPNQQHFWFRSAARNAGAVAPVQVVFGNQQGQAPPVVAPAQAAMPQVSGPLNMPNEYYCKELDGGYTLRTLEQIATMTGEWRLSTIGFPYFVRTW